jgi:hypothetical protein
LAALLAIGTNSPFYHLLLRPVVTLSGESEFAYRFPSVVFGILAVPLLYRVGRRWLGQRSGLLAALLLAVCPFHLLYSQDARMYTMLCFFSLAAMCCFEIVLRGKKWVAFILCSALAYLSHYAAVFLIYVQLVCLLSLPRRSRFFRRWFAAQMVALLPLASWIGSYLYANWEAPIRGISWIPRPSELDLLYTLWNFGSGDTDTWTVGVTVLAALFALTLVRGVLSSGRASRILAWWLFLPLVANFVVSLRKPLYVDRFFIGSLPAYILLLVAGGLGWRSRWLRAVSVLGVLGVMTWGGLRIVGNDPYFAREDWRGATVEVEAGLASGDVVLLQDYETLVGVSAYRTQEWPHVVLESGEVSVALEDALVRHKRVWLVWRSPRESNHRLCKSEPFDIFAEAPPPVRAWLASYRDQVGLDLRLPGLSVVRVD